MSTLIAWIALQVGILICMYIYMSMRIVKTFLYKYVLIYFRMSVFVGVLVDVL